MRQTVLEQVKEYLRKTRRLKTLAALEKNRQTESLSFKILKPPERKKHEISKNAPQKIQKNKEK